MFQVFRGRGFCCWLLGILVGLSLHTKAQTSNKGTDFWVAYTGHVDGTSSKLTLFITSEYNATVQIAIGPNTIATFDLVAKQAKAYTINPKQYDVYVGSSGVVEKNKAIHVTSNLPIVVYSHISIDRRSAATLIFPTTALGKEYYAVSHQASDNTNSERKPEFTLVGVEDNTLIEITPTQKDIGSTYVKGQTFTITLNKGEIYQYQSADDITGSYIRTSNCKPLSVFSGSTWAGFCESGNSTNASGADNLYQQLIPVSSWGKNFVTAPFYNAEHGNVEIYKIQVAEDNTTILVNGSSSMAQTTALNNPYSKGSIITFNSTQANVISADKPISVTQFQTSQSCNSANSNNSLKYPGDPEMTILSPVEQTLTDITLYSAVSTAEAPTGISSHYINVIIKTADAASLKIDDVSFPLTRFKSINSVYSYLIEDVTQSSLVNPTHRITAEGGFSAIAYGYGNVESYGYLAGSDLKDLTKNVELRGISGDKLDYACTGSDINFVISLPYASNTLTFDFGSNTTPIQINNPVYTQAVVNNVTVYKYTFNRPASLVLPAGNIALKVTAVNPYPLTCSANEDLYLGFLLFDPPVPAFEAADGCQGGNISFKNTSDLKNAPIKTWTWDFGDGTSSNEESPTHTYASTGTFEVKLTAITESGCDAVTSEPVTIHVFRKPIVNFSSSGSCLNAAVSFNDLSSSADGIINKRIWSFGDGTLNDTLTTETSHTHIFKAIGTYTVSLKIITEKGCEAILAKTITITLPPVPDFELPGACVSDVVQFINTTDAQGNTALQYTWNFNDPSTDPNDLSTSVDGSHKYIRAGDYSVTLTARSASGCEVSVTKVFTVNGSDPSSAFEVLNPSGLCSDEGVSFVNRSAVDFGKIIKLEWYFDYDNKKTPDSVDNDPQEGKIIVFKYPTHHSLTPVNYNVRLVAYSGSSCFTEVSHIIHSKGVPELAELQDTALCMENGSFKIASPRELAGFAKSDEFFAGSGVNRSGTFNPYAAGAGSHSITYTYVADNGCSETRQMNVEVYPTPVINMSDDVSIDEGEQIQLTAQTTPEAAQYSWTPTSGLSRSDISNPIARPDETTLYTVEAITSQGCTSYKKVLVRVLKNVIVPTAFTPNNDNVNDTWELKYLSDYKNFKVNIFSRYGTKVYSSTGFYQPWDGKANGEDLPAGTYYYIIEPGSGRKPLTGYVSILR